MKMTKSLIRTFSIAILLFVNALNNSVFGEPIFNLNIGFFIFGMGIGNIILDMKERDILLFKKDVKQGEDVNG